MNILKITMQGTSCWLDLNLIPLIMSWAGLHALIYVLCRICILPFVLRIPILPRPTIDNNINSDSQLFIFPFLIMSRAAQRNR